MEALQRTVRQYLDQYRSLAPSQRMTFAVIPLLLLGAFGFLIYNGSSSSYVGISSGRVFTTEELVSAEQSLREAGLTDYRRKGRQLFAPKSELSKYDAALFVDGQISASWADDWEKKFEKANFLVGKDQLRTMREIALAKELRRIIRGIPEIEDASVVWTPANKRRWRRRQHAVTATVSIKPHKNRRVSAKLVRSLQMAVAGMVPDLTAGDVTILDLSTGTAYKADQEGALFDNRLIGWIRELEKTYRDNISEAISYIPGVIVSVNVDTTNLKSYIEQTQVYDKKKSIAVQEDITKRDRTSSQRQRRAEPGVRSNQGGSVASTPAPDKTQNDKTSSSSTVTVPSGTRTRKEYIPAMPESVQVSVSIPRDYYQKVLDKQTAAQAADGGKKTGKSAKTETLADIEKRVLADIQATVTRHLPKSTTAADAVSVTTYDRLDPEVPNVSVPMTAKVTSMVTQWGGAVALAIFALWALRLLKKSTPPLPDIEDSVQPAALRPTTGDNIEPDEHQVHPEETERDRLQMLVRDDPETTVNVLGKWIQAGQ